MSKAIEERVISMEFNNKNFEKNVATTISSLDKLEKKSNLDGAAKGFQNLGKAAEKVDLTGMSKGIDILHAKFSSLEVMGVTALANITNSAVNAGKRMIKALTIDPIRTGFSEYETKVNAVQVIRANTRGKNTMEEITAALDELNKYADETIYNFAQMTSNIGKFTAQGLDVRESANAVKGLANLAGASGASAQDMARATYQMSQALGGTIRLIDWNSLRNANMATVELKNTLIDLARVHGIAIDQMIAEEGTFEQTLSKGWLTGKMFTEAMNIYSDVYSEAELKAMGFNDAQIKNFKDLATMAKSATTDVKTFTQLYDVLKETAQSGWTQTWEILFGDFEEAKKLFSNIYKTISPIIEAMSAKRNRILSNVLDSSWTKMSKQIQNAGLNVEEFRKELVKVGIKHNKITEDLIEDTNAFEKSLKNNWVTQDIVAEAANNLASNYDNVSVAQQNLTDKLEYFQHVVSRVWRGDYFNGAARVKALTDAGYDYDYVQGLVNKTEGIAGHILKVEDLGEALQDTSKYTDEEVNALRLLAKQASDTNVPLNQLINSLYKPSGKELLFDAFKNLFEAISKPIAAFKKGWDAIFPEEKQEQILYDTIKGFKELTEVMVISDDTAKAFESIARGMGSLFDLTIMGLKISLPSAIKIVDNVLNMLGMTGGEVLEIIANIITQIADFVRNNTLLIGTVNKYSDIVVAVINGIKKLIDTLFEFKIVPTIIQRTISSIDKLFQLFGSEFTGLGVDSIINSINALFETIDNWIRGLNLNSFLGDINAFFDEIDNAIVKLIGFIKGLFELIQNGEFNLSTFIDIGKYIIQGFINGISTYAPKILDFITNIFTGVINLIKSIFDMHSPSKVMMMLGVFVVEGFIKGLSTFGPKMLRVATGIFGKIIPLIKRMFGIHSPSTVMMTIAGFLVSGFLIGLTNSAGSIEQAIYKLGRIIYNAFKNVNAFDMIAVGLSAGLLFVLNNIMNTLKAIANIAIKPIKIVDKLVDSFSDFMKTLGKAAMLEAVSYSIYTLAKAFLVLSAAIWIMSNIEDTTKLLTSAGVLAGLIIALGALTWAMSKVQDPSVFLKMSVVMIAIAAAVGIMAYAMIKLNESLQNVENPYIAIITIGMCLAALIGLAYLFNTLVKGKASKNLDKIGMVFLKFGVAMGVLAFAISALGNIDQAALNNALGVIVIVGAIMLSVGLVSRKGKSIEKAEGVFKAFGLAMLALAVSAKILGGIKEDAFGRAVSVIFGFGALLIVLIGIANSSESGIDKVKDVFYGFSAAILALSVAMKILGSLSIDEIITGGILIGGALGLMYALVKMSKKVAGDLSQASKNFVMFTGACVLLGIAIKILGNIGITELALAGVVIAGAAYMFYKFIEVSEKSGQHAAKAGLMIIGIGAAFSLMALAIRILSSIEPDELIKGIVAISAFSLMSLLLIKASEKAGQHADKAGKMMLSIGVALLLMAGAVAILTLLDTEKMWNATKALGLMIGAIAAVILASSQMAKFTKGTIKQVGILTVVVLAMAAAIWVLQDVNPLYALGNVTAIAVLMATLVVAMKAIKKVGKMCKGTVASLVAVTVMLGVLITALYLLQNLDTDNALKAVISITLLALGISAAMAILMGVGAALMTGAGALAALAAIGGLIVTIAVLAGSVVALGKFYEQNKTWFDYAIDAMFSIGKTFGSLISGAFSEAPKIGTYLSEFAANAKSFFDTLSGTNLDSLKILIELTNALNEFAKEDVITKINNVFKDQAAIDEFSTNLSTFATTLIEFNKQITEAGIEPSTTENVAKALTHIVDLLISIPRTGGALQDFFGEHDLEKFSTSLTKLGEGLKSFAGSITGLTFDQEQITSIGNVLDSLIEMADKLPETNGLWQDFFGKQDLGTFGDTLGSLATGLVTFANTINNSQINFDTIVKPITQLKRLVSVLDTMQDITVYTVVDQFESSLNLLAGVDFKTPLDKINNDLATANIENIQKAKDAVVALSEVIKATDGIGGEKVNVFVNAINALATATVSDMLLAFDVETTNIESKGNHIVAALQTGMANNTKIIYDTTLEMIEGIIQILENKNSAFTDISKYYVDRMNAGFKDVVVKQSIVDAINDILKVAVNTAMPYAEDFKNIGMSVVEGFAKGISSNHSLIVEAVNSMASLPELKARPILEVNSPSKVFRRIGSAIPEGFAQGISMLGSSITKATSDMSNKAILNTENAMTSILSLMDEDIDTQPTIRPVLDLTDIRNGAGYIDNLFSTNRSVSVDSNLRAINASMDQRNQNGPNSDVISAINKLNKDIGNIRGSTYNINGITYDDGSNVADAVKALVRAAKVERRS